MRENQTTSRQPNLILTGFMGTGKSSVGRLLARLWHRPFLDTDKEIERRTRRKIKDIFAEDGEVFFRNLERQCVDEWLPESGAIIATGGGILTSSGMREKTAFPRDCHHSFRIAGNDLCKNPKRKSSAFANGRPDRTNSGITCRPGKRLSARGNRRAYGRTNNVGTCTEHHPYLPPGNAGNTRCRTKVTGTSFRVCPSSGTNPAPPQKKNVSARQSRFLAKRTGNMAPYPSRALE